MTAEELRSDNRFLIDQLKEALEENRRLKEDISEIKQDLKESNRRADEEAAGRKRLFDKLIIHQAASRMLAMMSIQTAFTTHSYRHVSNNAVTLEIFSWTMSRLGTRVGGTLASRPQVACYQRDARTLSSWHSLHAHNKIS